MVSARIRTTVRWSIEPSNARKIIITLSQVRFAIAVRRPSIVTLFTGAEMHSYNLSRLSGLISVFIHNEH